MHRTDAPFLKVNKASLSARPGLVLMIDVGYSSSLAAFSARKALYSSASLRKMVRSHVGGSLLSANSRKRARIKSGSVSMTDHS
jgi:hypothetical protein